MLLLMCPAIGMATGMRCSHQLIRPGDNKLDVVEYCGEPALKEQVGLDSDAYLSGTGAVVLSSRSVEKWYYNCGVGKFKRVLVFEAGELLDIELGRRGLSGPHRCE